LRLYIALRPLAEDVSRFTVVVTARSADKGKRIVESLPEPLRNRVSYTVVEDVAAENAFDKVSPWHSYLHETVCTS